MVKDSFESYPSISWWERQEGIRNTCFRAVFSTWEPTRNRSPTPIKCIKNSGVGPSNLYVNALLELSGT